MAERRPLALVSLTPFFGGGEVYCERLANLLRRDFKLSAIVANEDLGQKLHTSGVETHLLAATSRFAKLQEVKHQLRRFAARHPGATVLLNGQAEANLVSAAKRLGLRCVLVRHTDLRLQSSALKRWLYRRNASRADAVIGVSESLGRQLSGFLASNKVTVIPHWLSPVPRNTTPHPDFRVLYVGRLEPGKGVLDLLQAARKLPGISFSLAGDGELRSEIERQSLANVHLLGFCQELAVQYAKNDLLVQPSHSEGSSLAVLEAMAHGLPCLVSDIPVLREISRKGKMTAMYRCGDADALAEAIRNLGDHPEARKALSDAALQMIATEYSRERALALYRSVL